MKLHVHLDTGHGDSCAYDEIIEVDDGLTPDELEAEAQEFTESFIGWIDKEEQQ
ncbi:MAG: hypothetical protein K0S80_3748 [Neobacillus sp.]|nr:hypothetical protein [Neobacillus sp.]